MMNKQQTFKDIMDLMTHDYAGYKDIQVDADPYLAKIDEDMSSIDFHHLVEDYLRDFNDGHVASTSDDALNHSLGFSARRDGDSLYVADIVDETRLQLGDEITHLNDETVAEVGAKYAKQLDNVTYRQHWDWLLKRATTITLASGQKFKLKRYNRSYIPEHSFKQIWDNTGYMKLTDFYNPKDMNKLLNEQNDALSDIDYLIVDVRKNLGGERLSYWGLLNYFVDHTEPLINHYPNGFGYKIRWTERNKINRLSELERSNNDHHSVVLNQAYQEALYQWQDAKHANQYEGMDSAEINHQLQPEGHLKHIYVLSDSRTGSAGEDFVIVAKSFDKVTVVGRNTRGTIDYEHMAPQHYDDFRVWYPTTRSKLIDKGMKLDGVGTEPDVKIPWTHEFLENDGDLTWIKSDIEKFK